MCPYTNILKKWWRNPKSLGKANGVAVWNVGMDGGLVGKVVQSANVVPMEAIWRYARTECLECLECEGRELHTVHRHRQYTSRPKAGLRQPSQEADTQSGLLCKGYRLRWKNDLFPKSKKPFPLTPGADGNSRLGSQGNWGNFRAFWRVCRLDTHTLHRQYFGHSRCLRQMKCWNGISEKQKVWWDENCRNQTGNKKSTTSQTDSLTKRLLTVSSMAFTRIARLTSSTLTPNSILILMRQVQNCR